MNENIKIYLVDGELFFVKKSDCKRYNFKPKSEK